METKKRLSSSSTAKYEHFIELFCEPVKVLIKNGDKEERYAVLNVSAELHSTLDVLWRKDLVVRVTDDQNPLFFYHLKLNGDNYQSLQVQQDLLVDFTVFPWVFANTLEQCQLEEMESNPRYVLQLILPNSSSMAVLNVVEIHPFKDLVYLQLKLKPGTNDEIVTYLSGCVTTFKARNEELDNHLNSSTLDRNGQLRMCEEELARSESEIDRLGEELREQAHSLKDRFNWQRCDDWKELYFQELQRKYDKECMDLNYNHNKVRGKLEAEVLSLKTHAENRFTLESTVHELRNRVSAAEDESHSPHQETQELRKENNRLNASRANLEKSCTHLNSIIVRLEHELKSKEMQLLKLQVQLEIAQEQKIRLSKDLELQQSLLTKKENAVKSLSDDLNEANEIIRKLQTDLRNAQAEIMLEVTEVQQKLSTIRRKR